MKILELTLLSNDLEGTEEFYNEILGLKVDQKSDSSISFLTKQTKLTFQKTKNQKPVYHFAFNIPNNQLNEALIWINSKIEVIESEPGQKIIDFENWNAKSTYFFDNNGNILEFIVRFDLDNKSDLPFESSGILSISEVAFVTDTVEALAKKFITENNFSYFHKQIQRNDFSVLGEDSGLVILVDSQRNWYPTPIKAESFWMKATIENKGKIVELESN